MNIIEHIIDPTVIVDNFVYDKNIIDTLVKTDLESYTGVSLYNKEKLLDEIENLELKNIDSIVKIIKKNMITQITFDKVFKSSFGLSLIFDKNDPIIIYKNKRVKLEDMQNIRKDIMETNLDNMPKFNKLFLDTLICILEYIIKKDNIVTYYCTMIPMPWLSLLKMKLSNNNYNYIDDIIYGKHYSEDINDIITMINKYEKTYKDEDEDKDNDDMYRMEVISYLNDMEVPMFLDNIEAYDKLTNSILNETEMLKKLLDFTSFSTNNIIKFYFINKLFKYIMTIEKFLLTNDKFKLTILSKIDSMTDDMYIIESAGLNLSIDLINTLIQTREFVSKLTKN
jgi:hypothetical protein